MNVAVEHEVSLMDFTKWLDRSNGSPHEINGAQADRRSASAAATFVTAPQVSVPIKERSQVTLARPSPVRNHAEHTRQSTHLCFGWKEAWGGQ